MRSLTDLQDFTSPYFDSNDPELLLVSDRIGERLLSTQLRTLAQCLMQAVPQVNTVTVGSGISYHGMIPATTYHRHTYWCNNSWVAVAVKDPCHCMKTELLDLEQSDFVRWKYSV
jgi:hypothetical protein